MYDNEIIRNRQINFYIMQFVWNLKKKQNKGVKEGIYKHLYFNKDNMYVSFRDRGRFSRVVNAHSIDLDSMPCKALEKLTGISQSLFLGNAIFNVSGLDDNIWNDFFEDKKTARERKNYKLIKEALQRETNNRNVQDFNFKALVRFVDKVQLQIINKLAERSLSINNIKEQIYEVNFNNLLAEDQKDLENYYKELQEHSKMVQTAIRYKTYTQR